MMRKLISLVFALILIVNAATALAGDLKTIDGLSDRKIKIHEAGLNPSADEMISRGISPTTGRNLDEVSFALPDGYLGAAVTGQYIPVMVQISNSSNGFNSEENIKAGKDEYKTAPVNGDYADIVYEACQASNGSLTRMTMIFSDVIPDYVGYIRSTRYTHVRLRQEWNCLFLTSGYATYIKDEWTKYGVPNPGGADRGKDPGPVYVGGVGGNKPWRKYYCALKGISDSNNKLYRLAEMINDNAAVPKDKDWQFANHTWLFTDEVPDGGDDANIIYVTFGHKYQTNSRLEYDEDTNSYYRYVTVAGLNVDKPYSATKLHDATVIRKSDENIVVDAIREVGDPITFNNVIIQSITMKWPGGEIPDPQLVGKGNADYFMCGKHYEGVWQRKDINSRTVFYNADGNEIELQRGRTLIILMNYSNKTTEKFNVKYEE